MRQIPFRWRVRDLAGSGDARARLDELFRRLRRVPYYASPVRRRQLDGGSLEALSPVDLQDFLRAREQFRDSPAPPPLLPSPAGGSPRTAVLGRGFRSQGPLRCFPAGWPTGVSGFAPQSLAAPPAELSRLAQAIVAGRLALPSLDHSAIAVIEPGDGWPGQEDRELWWRAFQVPAFEYLTGPGGEVLATDCQAGDGLHSLPGCAVFELDGGELLVTPLVSSEFAVARLRTGWSAELREGQCGCGLSGVRLVEMASLKVAAAAAGAGGHGLGVRGGE